MDWNDFIKWTDQTAVYPAAQTGLPAEFCYVILGLAGEVGELNATKWWDEAKPLLDDRRVPLVPDALERRRLNQMAKLGDCLWYIARAYRAFQVQARTAPRHAAPIDLTMTQPALLLCNSVKKLLRDGEKPDLYEDIHKLVDRCFLASQNTLSKISGKEDALEEVLDMVVAKLSKRKDSNTLHGSGDNR